MGVSDRKVTQGFTILVLLMGPWFRISQGTGGWVYDVGMLLAAFWIGRQQGLKSLAFLLFLGYGAAFLAGGGTSSLDNLDFLPWVSLLSVWGTEHEWKRRSTLFSSLVLAGIIGVLQSLSVFRQGMGADVSQNLILFTLEQYRQAGLLETLARQGITEADIRTYLQSAVQLLWQLTPGFAALGAMLEYSVVSYFFARWAPLEDKPFPGLGFLRLPWFAIWGVNLGMIAYLLGDQEKWPVIRLFGMNLMLIYAGLALVLGSSVFLYYLRLSSLSGFAKGILLFGSFMFILITVINLILIGLFDCVLNFRRLPEDNSE